MLCMNRTLGAFCSPKFIVNKAHFPSSLCVCTCVCRGVCMHWCGCVLVSMWVHMYVNISGQH